MTKQCPRCGAAFECTHDAFCQCVGVQLSDEARQLLRDRWPGQCLCRRCLETLC